MIVLCNKLIRFLFELGRKQKNYDASKVLVPIGRLKCKWQLNSFTVLVTHIHFIAYSQVDL
ncbi:hypothetical protein J41TS12_30630 [Paenibacillus antibioticophila]|uniref:Uncharacterized protein n=1 Tax=Paenibacillus antibioticophila TaxID=1274374 RepID=A0A920CIV0_9BACL|nr:hypothetical protein J41TS12_30630 [Paenibacillus antibioticophila]